MHYQAHETACVDNGATIGEGTRVWHFSHVCARATIGRHCSLGQNTFVANNVSIGDRCKIQNNVSIYEGVELDDEVFCGPSMVFTNVRTPRAGFPRNTADDFGPTRVGHGATIGANATIVCPRTIGRYAFIAAGAVVTKDVPAFALMAGVPAKQIGWMSRFGEQIPLSLQGEGTHRCPHLGDLYRLDGTLMTLVEIGDKPEHA